ncbi:Elongation factor 1-alpha [Corchorus olitorius]|uniref:Elongation factor 1-alpha n=1 Tax=Corchorus olitorius TaxID=93759 RepID=A0A1R3JEZ2_9ROSI|nr:Elongation factor 1-alpha [Corchorus olitorius]
MSSSASSSRYESIIRLLLFRVFRFDLMSSSAEDEFFCKFYGWEKDCRFYDWHDERFTERSKEIIMELRGRERMLLDNVRRMKDEINQLRRNVVEQINDEIIEENSILKSEVAALRLQLDQASEAVISSRNRG